METLFTVLITLGVVSIIGIIAGVIGLMRRVKNLEQVREEIRVVEDQLNRRIDDEVGTIHRELENRERETTQYFDRSESNLDRRFDNVWQDIHKLKVT
jgi:biopolymer transport protein ExbB/TolQ